MPRALIFDSGVGGLSVVEAIRESGAALTLDYLADSAWLPYGNKDAAALRTRIIALLSAAVERLSPDAIVMACNTASTIALEAARATIATPIIGVVPAIKPAAAQTKTGVIGLLATPATVRRPYTEDLIAKFASGLTVLRHGDAALVAAVEAKLAGERFDPACAGNAMRALYRQPGGDRIDCVVLACTHFPLIAADLAAASPHPVRFLDSGAAIARRLGAVIGGAVIGGAEMWIANADIASPLGTAYATAPDASRRALTGAGFGSVTLFDL